VPVAETDLSVCSFSHDDIRRIRMVLQLQNDLGLNLSGAALAIELLDEIDRLHKIIEADHR
jgi:chaperone modulatory protein CbpM